MNNNITYIEAITHIRKYKKSFSMESIAKQIDINPDQFRNIVSQRQYSQELPEKYRTKFIEVVKELTSVKQEVPNDLDDERLTFLRLNDLND